MNTNRYEICVIGLGNLLMQDDAVGIRTIEAMEKLYRFQPHIDLIDGGTAGLDLLPVMDLYERVIFVDAVDAGESPGEIVLMEGNELPSFLSAQGSVHHVGLADLLFAAKISDTLPSEIYLVGIQPKSIDIGIELTDVLQDRLEAIIAAVAQRLSTWGVETKPLGAQAHSSSRQ